MQNVVHGRPLLVTNIAEAQPILPTKKRGEKEDYWFGGASAVVATGRGRQQTILHISHKSWLGLEAFAVWYFELRGFFSAFEIVS